MEIYKIVLKLLESKRTGVLLTVINGSDEFKDRIGEHFLWVNDLSISEIEGMSERLRVDSLFTGLPNEVTETILELCQKTIGVQKFFRERFLYGDEWIELMFEPVLPLSRLIILGCGHVGQALARMAYPLGLPLIVADDRPDFANKSLFPEGTEVFCRDFVSAIAEIDPGEADFVVIATRGHSYDRICLEKLAGRKLCYLGMLGSKSRVKKLKEELIKDGVSKEWIERLYAPIGLDIGAETPEEIAISILAEIIKVRRGRDRGNA